MAVVPPITVIIADVTVRLSRSTTSTVDSHQVESLDKIFGRVRDYMESETWESMERVTRESMETYKPKLIPTTKASIQGLDFGDTQT